MYEIYFGFSVRYVGGGNRPNARGSSGLPGRTSAASVDDLHDDDARSTAASSYVSSHMSARPVHIAPVAKDVAAVRRATFEISRESSKESSNSESDEQLEQQPRGGREQVRSHPSQSSLSSEASRLSRATTPPPLPPAHNTASPPLPTSHSTASPPLTAHSPTSSRRSTRLMVKSYSQDAPNDIGKRKL